MKLICIGRNYIDHAKELNNPIPEKPVFFLKPDSALVRNNKPFFYPDFSEDVHHEIELVIRIQRLGRTRKNSHTGITVKLVWGLILLPGICSLR